MTLTAEATWQEDNRLHLAAVLDDVLMQVADDPSHLGPADRLGADAGAISASMTEEPALVRLAALFGLDRFSCDVVAWCAGDELDPRYRGATGPPTVGRALERLSAPSWRALHPMSPLRRWGLVDLETEAPFVGGRLRLAGDVLQYLLGLPPGGGPAGPIVAAGAPVAATESRRDLAASIVLTLARHGSPPPSGPAAADGAAPRRLVAPPGPAAGDGPTGRLLPAPPGPAAGDGPARWPLAVPPGPAAGDGPAPRPLVALHGSTMGERRLVAQLCAEALGADLLRLDLRDLPAEGNALDRVLTDANRLARLSASVLLVEVPGEDSDHEAPPAGAPPDEGALRRAVAVVDDALFVSSPWPVSIDPSRRAIRREVPGSDPRERLRLWQAGLSSAGCAAAGPPAGLGPTAADPAAPPAGLGPAAADPDGPPAGLGPTAADPAAPPAGLGPAAADPDGPPAGLGPTAADPHDRPPAGLRPTAAGDKPATPPATPPPAWLVEVAFQYRLDSPTIAAVSADAVRLAASGPVAGPDGGGAVTAEETEVRAGCRRHARMRLDRVAHRVAVDDDIEVVLPALQREQLDELADHIRLSYRVTTEWGMGGARAPGVAALFAGPSGTGKTLAASALARGVGLDLYRVDLATVMSKYIGETEKNLQRIFDAAESGGAILLFDEADALFGKRSEVKDSHDRYANISTAYLLQKMEQAVTPTVLTTNTKAAIDPAFARRLRFVVEFPFPDQAARQEIWRRVYPSGTPTAEIDPARLATLTVNGATIRRIALRAAFLAARDHDAVTMHHLVEASRRELRQAGRTLRPEEVAGWA